MEKLNTEAAKRISRAEQSIEGTLNSYNDKMKQVIGQVNKLEQDVRIQVDKAIRDLEATDLR